MYMFIKRQVVHWSISSHSITIHTHTYTHTAGNGRTRCSTASAKRRRAPRSSASTTRRGRSSRRRPSRRCVLCLLGRATNHTNQCQASIYLHSGMSIHTTHTVAARRRAARGGRAGGAHEGHRQGLWWRLSFACISSSSLLCRITQNDDASNRRCEQESEDGEFVLRTINRARLWEIQTPQVRFWKYTNTIEMNDIQLDAFGFFFWGRQVIKPKILADAFKHVQDNGCVGLCFMWWRLCSLCVCVVAGAAGTIHGAS